MTEKLFHRYKVIDVDTHITEPAEVWTARVSSKWGNKVPHIRRVEGRDVWFIGDQPAGGPGFYTMAGHHDTYPNVPMGYDDIPAASYDAHARLKLMDEEGIYAMVLYPNLGGFGSGGFLRLKEPALMLECVRAYNDFLVDWASADPNRLLPVLALPFWDVAESVKEIQRSAAKGHRAVLFGSRPETFGQPPLAHKHWDPIWAAAQDHGLPVSFHIGSGDFGDEFSDDRVEVEGYAATSARAGAKLFMQNGAHVLDLLFSGILVRYPKLRFISVESGIGWLPFLLQSADYQYEAMAVKNARSDLAMLPSEYFKRQVYACCWFERIPDDAMLEFVGRDNIMFETDFPHPTSIYGQDVQDTIDKSLGSLSEDMRHRVLWENARKLYEIEAPAAG